MGCLKHYRGISLAFQWLRLHASKAGDKSSIPGLGPQILHAEWYSLKKKKYKNSYKNILTQPHCRWVMLVQAEPVTIIFLDFFYSLTLL